MALLISFLIGIQLFHAVASVPLTQFLHPSCNSLEVKTAAEVALNKHNKYRTEGYIFGLQRIFDAYEISEQDGDSVFYLILDVLETKCHVLSKKLWKECEFREPYETVFGQCKVIIKLNKHSNDSFLYRNDCILRPHSSPPCPGCPSRQNASEDRFQEIARESLAKFNAENDHDRYFAFLEVTKASSQVVYGILYAIEFTIQETSCPKRPPVSDIAQCSPLPTETAVRGLCKSSVIGTWNEGPNIVTANCELFPHPERGLCKGSVRNNEIEKKKYVTVECHFFPSPPPVIDEQTPQSTSEPPEPPKQKETVGQVIYHYPWSKQAVPEVQEPNPTPSPTFASPEEKARSLLAKLAKPGIFPFPRGFSVECPGDIQVQVDGLELPSRPQPETSSAKNGVQN